VGGVKVDEGRRRRPGTGQNRVVTLVEISLLGRFAVTVDGTEVSERGWTRRHAAAMVKVLALTPSHRLHREQLIDAVWPDDTIEEASPKLHKAAHFARKATGCADAIVLRDEAVHLFPGADIRVDATVFDDLARRAIADGDAMLAEQALSLYGGELAPQDPYEVWAEERREQLRRRHLDVLRLAGRWDEVAELDPGDERAHVELMRRHAAMGDRHAALRQFERLDRVLRRELGVAPGAAATAMRDELLAANAVREVRSSELVGRDAELSQIERALAAAGAGNAQTIVVSGPAGIGKTSLLRAARESAAALGWRVGHGSAAAVEGAWPYAPVVEALADLCRRHATLLDGLADTYRDEIDGVLAGSAAGWSGRSGHQRLFVAAAELVRLAAGSRGVLLTIDDLHDADEASLRLIHYLARATTGQRVTLVLGHRPVTEPSTLAEMRESLVGRHGAIDLPLSALGVSPLQALVSAHVPDADDELVERIGMLSGGVPFAAVELARRAAHEPDWVRLVDVNMIGGIAPATREVLQRVAVVGLSFDTDEFVALSGLPEAEAYEHLDAALASTVVEPTASGYQYRHGLVRDALLEDVPPHRRRLIHRDAAARLEALDASPARIGYHLLHAGEAGRAVAYYLRAAERAAAMGAYRDALELVDAVRANAGGTDRAWLLALRADLLMAVGDQTAVSAYREALDEAAPEARRLLRVRLARAAVMSGDLATAAAAMTDVAPDGGDHDGEILLVQGMIAFFGSDFDTAWTVTEEAQRRVLAGEKNWQVLDLVSLQGLLAHRRGEWFDRMRVELRRTRDAPEVANSVFDGYLCAAEYVLYGPTPYREVIDLARGMRATAERSGALRAVAFATALIGEAALLSGDLDLAARELREAADLHHDLGSTAGEAHSLQRLAEVHIARGDRDEATRLLHQALPLARWSMIAMHLLQRIYGTMIAAAPDALRARAEVDRAEAALGVDDWCQFCSVMLSVPAAIACADVGDVDHARHHLGIAERSAQLWEGTAWEAALAEASAHLAASEGAPDEARRLFASAHVGFAQAGQPRDAARCDELARGSVSAQ
jgi:DNA-binding SARP family transcriptional activator/tetratricopeptide (TPR) repeat protein